MEQKQKTEKALPKGPVDIFSKSFKSIAVETKKLMLGEVENDTTAIQSCRQYHQTENSNKQRWLKLKQVKTGNLSNSGNKLKFTGGGSKVNKNWLNNSNIKKKSVSSKMISRDRIIWRQEKHKKKKHLIEMQKISKGNNTELF